MALCLSLASCNGIFVPTEETEESEGLVFAPSEESAPKKWEDALVASPCTEFIQLTLGDSTDISSYYGEAADGLEWSSECPSVVDCTEDGIISASKIGRCELYGMRDGSVVKKILVTVEATVQYGGFDFTTDLVDGTVYAVESVAEANRILDNAVARHIKTVYMDFSAISQDFNVKTDFVLNSEFGGHTSLKMMFHPATPQKVEFEIIYNTDAASYTTPTSKEYYYQGVQSANTIARLYYYESAGAARAKDYDDFAINSRQKTFEVYNSEELWWAVEHGYKPVFPLEGTRAELIYERAKMILRDIVSDGMTDYEKALSVYEYLISAVSYDYDSYYNPSSADSEKNNTCYYLEGVFEQGRAVCDGKSKAIVLLLGIEGIDCVRAFGTQLDGQVGHAWNYVKIGDNWYMIDTTEGDDRFENGSAVSDFFGGQLETVGYESFLIPAYTHCERYEYTDMWSHLISQDKNYAYPEDYFEVNLKNSDYDFIINSSSEVNSILDAVYKFGMPDKFILTFKPSSEFFVSGYFSGVEKRYGVEKEIYKTGVGTYIAIFKTK